MRERVRHGDRVESGQVPPPEGTPGGRQDEPVNLGAGKEISIRDLAELVAEVVGFKGRITWDISMPNGQPRRSVDASRARELFGFEPATPFREGIERTVAWYRSARPASVGH